MLLRLTPSVGKLLIRRCGVDGNGNFAVHAAIPQWTLTVAAGRAGGRLRVDSASLASRVDRLFPAITGGTALPPKLLRTGPLLLL